MKIIAWCCCLPLFATNLTRLVIWCNFGEKPDDLIDYSISYAILATVAGIAGYFWFRWGIINWIREEL